MQSLVVSRSKTMDRLLSNCDFPEAMMNSSFDWNGAREPYVLATENDTLNGVGMLFGKLLTNTAESSLTLEHALEP